MNDQEFISNIINNLVSQCIIERENNWRELPMEQQETLEQILDAVHTIFESKAKISPEYQKQVQEAIILKAAAESGLNIE
jgi:hypothetical protein